MVRRSAQPLYSTILAARSWSPNYGWSTANVYQTGVMGEIARRYKAGNFSNENDYALSEARSGINQRFKPDNGTGGYLLGANGVDAEEGEFRDRFYRSGGLFSIDILLWSGMNVGGAVSDELNNSLFYHLGREINPLQGSRYHLMSYLSQSRHFPLGATPSIVLSATKDLQLNQSDIWPLFQSKQNTPDQFIGNYSDHRWHSAQFRMTMPEKKEYWKALIGRYSFHVNASLP